MRFGYISSVTNKFLIGKLKVCMNAFRALIISLTRLVTVNSKGEKLFLHIHTHKQELPRKQIMPNSEFLEKRQSGDSWMIEIR